MLRSRHSKVVVATTGRFANRPDTKMDIPEDVMFTSAGPTGPGRIRNLGDYKGSRSEHDFADQHNRFTEEEEE